VGNADFTEKPLMALIFFNWIINENTCPCGRCKGQFASRQRALRQRSIAGRAEELQLL
jgi:hypothetical protein